MGNQGPLSEGEDSALHVNQNQGNDGRPWKGRPSCDLFQSLGQIKDCGYKLENSQQTADWKPKASALALKVSEDLTLESVLFVPNL